MNRVLIQGISNIEGLKLRDMYEIYPDFSIDIAQEQQVLLNSDVVIFQHPFFWYSCPALMKEWLDEVLEIGWAYGQGGTKLKDRFWMQIITTGGAADAYQRSGSNHFNMIELLRPFERTAKLCGMKLLKPFIVHSARNLSDESQGRVVGEYHNLLRGIVDGRLPEEYSS